MQRILVIVVCLATSLVPLTRTEAQPTPPAAGRDPAALFAVGNLEYILLHELAHLIIGDLDIPIIGSEESAADYLATATLIRADLFDAARAERARQFLLATANGLATSWDFFSTSGAEIQFWDSHALTIQRFYQMICLIYGSNREEFATLPARVGMPEARASRCPAEFAKASRSLLWLLENYGRASDDPPSAAVDVTFETVPTRASQLVIDELEASAMLDNLLRLLHERFTLPVPFRIAFRTCGQPQAAWLPDQREITVCYELLDNYYSLGRSRSASLRRLELNPP